MADANVQQGLVTDFGAGEDSTTDTLTTAVATANAFARIQNLRNTSAGPTAGTATTRFEDDMGATCLLTASDTVSFTRDANGANEDVSISYEVVEYPSSGNNAAIVRMHETIQLNDTEATKDVAITGVSNIGDCVPFVCGVSGGISTDDAQNSQCTLEVVDSGGAKLRVTRGGSTQVTRVSVAVVEFTGSNWSVQKVAEHTASLADTVETETISAVTWSQSFIVMSLRTNNDEVGHVHHAVFPGATTTTVKFYAGSTNSTVQAYVVSNANLTVTADDSIDGSEGDLNAVGASPDTIDQTMTSHTLSKTSVICTAYNTVTGTASSIYTAWNYYLFDSTTLRFWVAYSNSSVSDMKWTYQLIDLTNITDAPTGQTINRVLTENTVVTDPVPGYELTKERPANSNVELLTDAMFLYYAYGRLLAENFPATDAYIMEQNLRRDISEVIGSRQELQHPSDFSAWSRSASVISDTDLDPDGQLTADTIEDNTAASTSFCRSFPGNVLQEYTSGENISFSVHVKKDAIPKSTRHGALRVYFNSGRYVHLHFDTSTGEVSPVAQNDAEIKAYGYEDIGDYRRFYLTCNDGGTGAFQYYVDVYPAAGFDLNNYDVAATGSIVACRAMTNRGYLQPYETADYKINDVIALLHLRFRQVVDSIDLEDSLSKTVTIGEIGTTYSRVKQDRLRMTDTIDAQFFGTYGQQLSDSLLVNEAAFLQRFKRLSVADQIEIATELLTMTRSRVRRDSLPVNDSVAAVELKIRNITTFDSFNLSDLLDQEVTGIRRKKLADMLTAEDAISHEQGSTLQPSTRIEVGIEER